MVCIYCSAPTRVTNSRHQKRNNHVWRRRRCTVCQSIITTEEAPIYQSALSIRGSDGRLEAFSRDILLISLHRSLGHRKRATADAAALADTVISLLRQHQQTETTAAVIDKDTLVAYAGGVLERFDSVAGAHYHAYHPA